MGLIWKQMKMKTYSPNCLDSSASIDFCLKGLEGEVKFTGTSPELDDFVIRFVDGRSATLTLISSLT